MSMDMKEKKLTVVGEVDITNMVEQLRKLCQTEIVWVGSAVEVAEKEEPKKMEPKEPMKPKEKKESKYECNGDPGYTTIYYYDPVHVEEHPSFCVIC